jgi:hypothetical protein
MGRSMKNLENFIERFLLVIEVRRRVLTTASGLQIKRSGHVA